MLEHFHFIRPIWFLALVPFLLLIIWQYSRDSVTDGVRELLPKHLNNVLTVGDGLWAQKAPIILLAVIGIITILILAGPSWQREVSPIEQENTPLIIVLDVSDSMLEPDVAPNRLYRAKQKIKTLLAKRNTGETALIVYAGSAHQAMPLTRDNAIYTPLLEAISPDVMPRKGKFDHYVPPVIEQTLGSTTSMANIVLMTDSINTEKVSDWQYYLEQKQHNLIVWGIGNPSVASNLPFEEASLKHLVSEVNGDYVRFSADDNDITTVLNRIVSNVTANGETSSPWLDSGYNLVWLIIPIYLLWARRGWLVQWAFAFTLITSSFYAPPTMAESGFIDLWMSKDQQGQYYFQKQDYLQAAQLFDDPAWKAYAFYQAGDYERAQNYFLRTDDLTAQLGVGAALAHQKEYVAAKKWYRTLLEHYPNNETVKTNLNIVEGIIAQIDQFSKSQTDNTEKQSSKDLADKPQTSEGVEQLVQKEQLIQETLSAEQILNNKALNDQWMQRVESHLAPFLSNKFYLQLEMGIATQTVSRQ